MARLRRWELRACARHGHATYAPAERLLRAVLLGLATYGVLRFRDARGSIQAWLERYLPAFRATGVHVDQFALVRDLQHALAARSSQLTLVAALLGAYAALEAIE